MRTVLVIVTMSVFALGCKREQVVLAADTKVPATTNAMTNKVVKSDAEWKQQLTPEQYKIMRKKGTERAFTGPNWDNKEKGTYKCAGCGQELFSSAHKFDSGTGWPSYWQPIADKAVATEADNTFF